MRISSVLLHRIMTLAASDPDREVCGLLLGERASSPVRFERSREPAVTAIPCPSTLLGMNGGGNDIAIATIADILPAANVHPEPARRFELDPAAHFAALRAARSGGPAILGHYHSHPNGRPAPSTTDATMALEPGQLWLIVAGNDARLWIVSHPGTFGVTRLVVTDAAGCAAVPEPPQEPLASQAQ